MRYNEDNWEILHTDNLSHADSLREAALGPTSKTEVSAVPEVTHITASLSVEAGSLSYDLKSNAVGNTPEKHKQVKGELSFHFSVTESIILM